MLMLYKNMFNRNVSTYTLYIEDLSFCLRPSSASTTWAATAPGTWTLLP